MNRITYLFAVVMALTTAFSVQAVNTSDYVIDEGVLIGDVNCDSHLTSADVTAIYDYLLNGDQTYYNTCDVDGDGHVTSADVTAVYDLLLNGGGHVGGSVIKMSDFVPNSLTNYNSEDYQHQWVDGDVIFVAVDPDYSGNTVCQNVYAMVRTGGKWVLQDVQGSNKVGFNTSGGTLCAVYVQHADLSKSYYDYIPLTGDVACVNSAAIYTVTPKNGKFYIKINDIILHHFVSRIDVNGAYQGDYFYESVTHLDALTRIVWQSLYTYSAFETSGKAPVIDIDNNTHKGYAYGVWRKDTYANGWLTFNYAKYNGYSYLWPYSQNALNQGRSLSINSPWKETWNRDLSMRYYNYDDKTNYRLNVGSTYQNVNITVGTNIIFRPWDGDKTDTQGSMTSVTSSNSGILDISYDNTQVSVTAHKMGTTTLNIKFKTKDNINCTYTYEVTVEPTVWIAGSKYDAENEVHKAGLWRNWQDRSATLNNDNGYYNTVNRIIVRHNTAFILMGREFINPYATTYTCQAAIYKATYGGYFSQYKSGLTGVSKYFCKYDNGLERSIYGVPRMWVDKNDVVYYTSCSKQYPNSTDYINNWINTDIYKGTNKILSIDAYIVNDMVTDNSGKLYLAGTAGNYYIEGSISSANHYSRGFDTSRLAIIDSNNNPTYITWTHYLFNKLYEKDGAVYVDAAGFYGNYGFLNYKSVFLRYTPSTGLALYTGQVSANGFSMGSLNYDENESIIHPYPFILYGNKFYFNGISTYQLGASEVVPYAAIPNGYSVCKFDCKNGKIGMVMSKGSSYPFEMMVSALNATNSTHALENSENADIYDVWMQTSLDE